MARQFARGLLDRLQLGSHGFGVPLLEELLRPSGSSIVPEMAQKFFQLPGIRASLIFI